MNRYAVLIKRDDGSGNHSTVDAECMTSAMRIIQEKYKLVGVELVHVIKLDRYGNSLRS